MFTASFIGGVKFPAQMMDGKATGVTSNDWFRSRPMLCQADQPHCGVYCRHPSPFRVVAQLIFRVPRPRHPLFAVSVVMRGVRRNHRFTSGLKSVAYYCINTWKRVTKAMMVVLHIYVWQTFYFIFFTATTVYVAFLSGSHMWLSLIHIWRCRRRG